MIKRMFKTQTGMYFWPKGTESTNGYINTAEGEFCYLYPEAEHAATQAALKKAEELLEFLKPEVWNDEDIDEALKLIRDARSKP